jgi:uncharacterized protein DUF4157
MHDRTRAKRALHDKPSALSHRSDQRLREIVDDGTKSGGRPLPASTRQRMEAHFGHDFGAVRVHDDAAASRSARALVANAYAVGSDVVFKDGEYSPGSGSGDRLLAHELAHVVQHDAVTNGHPDIDRLALGERNDSAEFEARLAAQHLTTGRGTPSLQANAPAVARDEDEDDALRSSSNAPVSFPGDTDNTVSDDSAARRSSSDAPVSFPGDTDTASDSQDTDGSTFGPNKVAEWAVKEGVKKGIEHGVSPALGGPVGWILEHVAEMESDETPDQRKAREKQEEQWKREGEEAQAADEKWEKDVTDEQRQKQLDEWQEYNATHTYKSMGD